MSEEEIQQLDSQQQTLEDSIPDSWYVLWCPYKECLTSLMFTREFADSLPNMAALHAIQSQCMEMMDHKGNHKGSPRDG